MSQQPTTKEERIPQTDAPHKTGRGKVSHLTICTLSGRRIPAPPPIRTSSNQVAARDLIKLWTWLAEQARAEAQARRDDFNEFHFSHVNPRNFPPAEAAACNVYLFGEEYPEFDARTGERLTKPSRGG